VDAVLISLLGAGVQCCLGHAECVLHLEGLEEQTVAAVRAVVEVAESWILIFGRRSLAVDSLSSAALLCSAVLSWRC